nr:hypothetical protein [Saprospiraceae bacterium]
MHPILRNTIAVAAGIILGSAVNMAIIQLSGFLIPPPEGADLTTLEGLKDAMHLFQAQHFIMPFLAHALGTLVGAWVAASLTVNHKMKFALGIGVFFMLGGITNIVLLPSPIWFAIVDLSLAYLPMSYLAGKIAARRKENSPV